MAAVMSGAPKYTIICLKSRKHTRTFVETHDVDGHVILLTPWTGVHFQKEIVTQLKKYLALYENRNFITVYCLWDMRSCSLVGIYLRFEGT
jgi:hypothetical protein